MQTGLNPEFVSQLSPHNKQMVELVEFYLPDEVDYSPANAIRLYSTSDIYWGGHHYKRQVTSRSQAKRYLGRDTNSVTVNFGTNSEEMVRFMTSNRIEGMWLQIRRILLNVPEESLVVFGGRCQKPDDQAGTIQAVQEIGGGAQVPKRKLWFQCPLVFKGKECLGGIPNSSHTPEYQAASTCNKSVNQCDSYGNFENFQGFRFQVINGTFSYSVTEVKRFLLFFTKKKTRTVSASWSSVSDLNEDVCIPEVGGVTQLEFVPLMHADTGIDVKSLQAVAEGEIDGIFNVQQKDKQYLPNFINFQETVGKFGSSGQPESALFPGAGKFSGTAWVEFIVTGSNPSDANDSSPTVVGVVRGRLVPLPDATGAFTQRGWTDVGPMLLRFYLTEFGRHPVSQIDDEAMLQAFRDCNEPVIDDTGFDQIFLPQQVTGGLDFKAFALALGFGQPTVDRIALMMLHGDVITGGYGQLVQAYYRYINQQQPPSYTVPTRRIRRRYTTNFVLTDQTPIKDFIYDILLTSFNGYLIFNSKGQIRVKVDKPVPTSYLLSAAQVGDSSIHIEDVAQWRSLIRSQVLVGAHQKTSEIQKAVGWSYSSFGNAIVVAAATTGGLAASFDSATLTGGGGATPATATLTLSGTPATGDTIGLLIDGIPVDYPATTGDNLIDVAGLIAATVNGHPVLKRYIRADWNPAQGAKVVIWCKSGNLELDKPLDNFHGDFEEAIRIEMAFGGPHQNPIVADSFKWPLGSRQTSANQFTGKFTSAINDWAKVPITRDYEEHQAYTHSVNTEEINLSAVDNAHQAARLLKITGGKRRLCDWFCQYSSTGQAMLLDVGDVIAVTHWTGYGEIQNVPVQIEEIADNQSGQVDLVCRLYRSDVYDDRINEMSPLFMMPLQTGIATNTSPDPPNNTGGTGGAGSSGAGGGSGPKDYPNDGYGTGGGLIPG